MTEHESMLEDFRDLLAGSRLSHCLKEYVPCLLVSLPTSIIIDHTPAVNRLFGYKGKELVGQHINKLIPERFREAHDFYVSKYSEHPTTKRMTDGHISILQKNGQETTTSTWLVPAEEGSVLVLFVE